MPYKICDTNCSHGGCARLTRRILRPPQKFIFQRGGKIPRTEATNRDIKVFSRKINIKVVQQQEEENQSGFFPWLGMAKLKQSKEAIQSISGKLMSDLRNAPNSLHNVEQINLIEWLFLHGANGRDFRIVVELE